MTELTEESLDAAELDWIDDIDWVNESFEDDDFGSILED